MSQSVKYERVRQQKLRMSDMTAAQKEERLLFSPKSRVRRMTMAQMVAYKKAGKLMALPES